MIHKTRILIVDDSRIFRSAIEESLKNEDDIEVIGSVRNGVKAIEFIRSNHPDLVTLDLEMPDMDGLETLQAIKEINEAGHEQHPIGVIMLSAFTRRGAEITMKALEAGAFDFIAKPEGKNAEESIQILRRQLVTKTRYFASRRIASELRSSSVLQPPIKAVKTPAPEPAPVFTPVPLSSNIKAVLIGVSTGGPKALMTIMPELCDKIHTPIFIVQHMPPTFTESLAGSLNAKCSYSVIEGKHNDKVRPRYAYIAPGGRHMLLRKEGSGVFTIVNDQPPENGCRPSVNILFRSALSVYGGDVIAVIMTGMGRDGTKGIGALKRAGAYIIAQDEASSVVWGMPGSAVASGHVDQVLPLNAIPGAIAAIVNKSV